jgi:hypothetical protein
MGLKQSKGVFLALQILFVFHFLLQNGQRKIVGRHIFVLRYIDYPILSHGKFVLIPTLLGA